MGEIFDKESKYGWIGLVFGIIRRNPQHIFQILTKCPDVLPQFIFPENVWLGITVDRQREIKGLEYLLKTDAKVKFICFEPLLEPIDFDKYSLEGIQWIIIGKLTGSRRVKLDMSWVMDISAEASRYNIPVFLKNNLGLENPKQEFPYTHN